MKNETLKAIWKKLWLEAVRDYKVFSSDETHHSAIDKAVKLVKFQAEDDFTDMTIEDFNNLIKGTLSSASE